MYHCSVKQTGKGGAEIRVDLEVSLMDGRSRVEESSAFGGIARYRWSASH